MLFWGYRCTWNTSPSHCVLNSQWRFMCSCLSSAPFITVLMASDVLYFLKMKVIFLYYSYLLVPLCSYQETFIWWVHSCAKQDENQSKPWQPFINDLLNHLILSLKVLKCLEQGQNFKLSGCACGICRHICLWWSDRAPFYLLRHPSSAAGWQRTLHQ